MMYYPHQAAEIVRLCIAAGVPEEAILWLRDGYSVDAVARELQQRSSRPHVWRCQRRHQAPRPPLPYCS